MRRVLAALLVVALLLLGCRDNDPGPPGGPRTELTFEVLHLGLEGPYTYASDRLEAMAESLDASPADVICVQGIWRPDDRASLAAALSSTFPYSLELGTDDFSLVDDPASADGTVPPIETEPACGDDDEVKGGALLLCLRNTCSEEAGAEAVMLGPFCLYGLSPCAGILAEVVSETDPRQRCRACVLSHVYAGDSLEATADRCRSRPGTPLAHTGQHGMMLLSRLPISDPGIHVLPAEGLRRAVISATVTSDRGALDVHCATLGPAELGLPGDLSTSEAYPGPYGDVQAGWRAEHDLQLDKLLAYVHARSGAGPAVLLGNFAASAAVTTDGEIVVAESSPTSVERLLAAYDEAVAPESAAACTLCSHNRMLSGDATPSWLNHIYLSGMPGAEIRESSRVYLGNVVAVAPRPWNPVVTRVPLTLQYGVRSTIAYDAP